MKRKDWEYVGLNIENCKVFWLDQTKLPNEEIIKETDDLQEMYDAIFRLEVRGAPLIGVYAAISYAVLYNKAVSDKCEDIDSYIEKSSDYLNSSRPTAVNLSWALSVMENYRKELLDTEADNSVIAKKLIEKAIKVNSENDEMTRKIGEYGVSLIKSGDGILTHCNAGSLACGRYGSATAPIYVGAEMGMEFKVYADETRPLLQGARLTSYELYKNNIDVTLICDNMASIVMKQGKINAVFVGCDRVAANGDTANKIGTSAVAILAKHYGIPFYVLSPYSTIDLKTKTGDDIVIEERNPNEIKAMFYEKPMALANVKCYNPAFDVTDNSLITAFITDKGIVYPPFDRNFKVLFDE